MATLADLLAELIAREALPAKRVKDIKTSIKYLAVALGAASPKQCAVERAQLDADACTKALDTHFQALIAQGRHVGAVTIRNTRSNVQTVLRAAAAHGLLTAPITSRLLITTGDRKAFLRQHKASSPYRSTYVRDKDRAYGLQPPQWPADIQAGWHAYRVKSEDRLRETTFEAYQRSLTLYWGYLLRVRGRTPTWEDLFTTDLLREFVRWHGKRMGHSRTVQGVHVVCLAATVAKVLRHENALDLAAYRTTVRWPDPIHNKTRDYHTLTLADVEAVADACLAEGRVPMVTYTRATAPGARRATRFQRGVILKLLVRVPIRQRNIREMQRDRHLFQDKGLWYLRFVGEDLKIGYRGEEPNVYAVDLSADYPELDDLLKEWFEVYRPMLPNAARSPFVFLTQKGMQFDTGNLHKAISDEVAIHTGKRFYPHLIRSIYATACRDAGEHFEVPSAMLGDRPATVQKYYYKEDIKLQQSRGRDFVTRELRRG